MLKTIFLLTPVYVTLFWSIALYTNPRQQTAPRLFLSKFMLIALVVYISHFFYFTPIPEIYILLDPFYQYASLLVYPVYHIYFRLLTVDSVFSLKKHWVYLLAPTVFFILYLMGVIFTDNAVYEKWVFDKTSTSNSLNYLRIVQLFIRLIFVLQVVVTLFLNFRLIKKYGYMALQYYSDIEDISTKRVNKLNTSMLVTGVASLIYAVIGRHYFKDDLTGIGLASLTFSSMLFFIGWLGDQQKALNPTYDTEKEINEEKNLFSESTKSSQLSMIKKLTELLEDKKIYLDSKLNIVEVAALVGSNRTYISSLINQNFGQNFCTYVNQYRVNELEKNIIKFPFLSNLELAELCGFGSVESMRRAVFTKTGKSFQVWRSEIKVN